MNEIFTNLPSGTVGAAVVWLALRMNAIEARLDAAGLPRSKAKRNWRSPMLIATGLLASMWLSGCRPVPA